MQTATPHALNEIGKRNNNEDSIFPPKGEATEKQRFFLVCDGMGGHETGEVSILYKSFDHSLVNELLLCGIITEEEAANHPKKNIITRAMQPHLEKRFEAKIHTTQDVQAGDRFFLCTDGVH